MTIRVVLVDDHAILRTGLKAVLGAAPEIDVVGEAAGGHEAVALLEHTAADVVVMDLSMVDGDGLTATRTITAKSDAVRVLVLTMHAEEAYLEAVLEAGASGYLVKTSADRELVDVSARVDASGGRPSSDERGVLARASGEREGERRDQHPQQGDQARKAHPQPIAHFGAESRPSLEARNVYTSEST